MLFRKKKFKSDLNLYRTAVREATVRVTIFIRIQKSPCFSDPFLLRYKKSVTRK